MTEKKHYRTAEANKAIAKAWDKEKEFILEGKATRDWTPEQQKDILETGKAHDSDGKAFEGHHMKSVEKFPEFQGDYRNIQFLSRTEHLDAHSGSFQICTNGRYDPVTKLTIEFPTDELISCDLIVLSKPVYNANTVELDSAVMVDNNKQIVHQINNQKKAFSFSDVLEKSSKVIKSKAKELASLIADHPAEFIAIGATLFEIGNEAIKSKHNGNSNTSLHQQEDIAKTTSNTAINVTNAQNYNQDELTVKAHSQRYGNDKHWVEKEPYKKRINKKNS